MSLRYRFVDFSVASTADDLIKQIGRQVSQLQAFALSGIPQAPLDNTLAKLRLAGAQTLLVQEFVRDPDFLAEHQAFYGKLHREVPRTCVRVHAFRAPFPKSPSVDNPSAAEVLSFLDQVKDLDQLYLGFVTLRPLRHAPVGASIIKPAESGEVTCYEHFPVHIAGCEFGVCGTPYLQQDNAVGACAQASIWMALRTQMKRVGNTAFTPAELTLAATRYLAFDRVFPGRHGLVMQQMLEAIRSAGHDPLTLESRLLPGGASAEPSEIIEDAIPYVDSGLPVIVGLFPRGGGHAVVSIGRRFAAKPVVDAQRWFDPLSFAYRVASDWVDALVIHNDNTGPYLPLASRAAVPGGSYCLEDTRFLVVPLPETVHLTAKEAEQGALTALAMLCFLRSYYDERRPRSLCPETELVLRTYLVQRHAFRKWAKDDPDLDPALKEVYRTYELPKLLWVVELHDLNRFNPADLDTRSRIGEVIVDASADALHGDAALCAHITQDVLPSRVMQNPVNDLTIRLS